MGLGPLDKIYMQSVLTNELHRIIISDPFQLHQK